MGEATPAQPTAGVFVPMLGGSMVGSMPGGVNGPIATSRGSAVPQLHSAIVERLRARIELCRRHHSTCETRYQRGQAENSDREHESTLHLLNIVHQGPGNRKTKGNRAAANQQAEYNRLNKEQKAQTSSEGEAKISTRIALQGSLRRKIEGHPPIYTSKQNGLSCGGSESDFKRLRMEGGSLGHRDCVFSTGQSQSMPGTTSMDHGLRTKDTFMMPHGMGTDLFNMTLKEMKKEPLEIQSCGQTTMETSMMVFDFKDEGGGQIDPELQDLFDELTKTVPSLNDLEFEKMLKQDDTFSLDLGRPSSVGAANLCTQMEKTIKTEYSPDFCQAYGSSPQLRPASAGPSFNIATSSVTSSQKNHSQGSQGSAGSSRNLPSWPEVSHAEQLKQMAANQQQPSTLLHHHQQNQPGGVTSWAPAMSNHSSPNTYAREKLPSPATLCQQRISPQSSILSTMSNNQSKGINNCLFKSNGHDSSNNIDMKVLESKPMLHFSPKASHPIGPQIPIVSGKSVAQLQQPSTTTPNQPHAGLRFPSPQVSIPGSPCLQPKPVPQRAALHQRGPGLHFKPSQQRQVVPPGQRLPTNGVMGMSAQIHRPPAPNNQQKNPGTTQAMQRQLAQQQHIVNDQDKVSTHDQFNRHLTRPPPNYKQPRNMGEVPQGNLYTDIRSSQSLTGNSTEQSDLQAIPCHILNGQGTKIPTSGDRRFVKGLDPHQGSCVQPFVTQIREHNNQNRFGLNQNKLRFPGPSSQDKTFESSNIINAQQCRTTVSQESTAIPRQGPGIMMTNVNTRANMSWTPDDNQAVLGVRRPTVQPQGHHPDMTSQHYPQRPGVPPNQVAPRPPQPRMPPLPGLNNLKQPSPEHRIPAGNFATSNHNHSIYQNNRTGRLTFDFLQEGDNTVPGINADSDFIDSLLKSDSGNDDWMKDINLDEILGSHS